MGFTTERKDEDPGSRAMTRHVEPAARARFLHTPVGVLRADRRSRFVSEIACCLPRARS